MLSKCVPVVAAKRLNLLKWTFLCAKSGTSLFIAETVKLPLLSITNYAFKDRYKPYTANNFLKQPRQTKTGKLPHNFNIVYAPIRTKDKSINGVNLDVFIMKKVPK